MIIFSNLNFQININLNLKLNMMFLSQIDYNQLLTRNRIGVNLINFRDLVFGEIIK
jgi:hypothetical protein